VDSHGELAVRAHAVRLMVLSLASAMVAAKIDRL
jgi:hypothetical protein